MKKKMIIDTDVGYDDILAIVPLLKSQYCIRAFTIVNGVSSVVKGSENLKRILAYLDKDITVAQGNRRNISNIKAQFPKNDRLRADKLTLLRNISLPSINTQFKNNAEELLYLNRRSLLIALGPLTNIAKTILRYGNNYSSQVKGIIMMGGGLSIGNVPPDYTAEYNLWMDPKAAQIVFSSGIPITLFGMDIAKEIPATQEIRNKVKQLKPKNQGSRLLREIIINNNGDFSYFYDPLISYFLLSKKSVLFKKVSISITKRGQTIISSGRKNVQVAFKINPNDFYNFMTDMIL